MSITKRTTIIPAFIGVALLAAATVGATTIAGTAGSDTLRGGAKADKLSGKGGHDKLYGAAGNDVLNGGPGDDLLVGGRGADKLSCGGGQDIARGDRLDKIASDCEIVTGVQTTLPVPTAPPPTAPPPTPPPAPVTPVSAGTYQGLLEGNFLFFQVSTDRAISGFRSNYIREDCDQGGYVYGTVDWGSSRNPIAQDGSFKFGGTSQGTVEDQPATFTDEVTGRIEGSAASGTVLLTSEFDFEGTHYRCSSGLRTWTASLVP